MPLKCSELFRCSGEWDEHGICNSICKQGFTGPHCLERGLLPFSLDECILCYDTANLPLNI